MYTQNRATSNATCLRDKVTDIGASIAQHRGSTPSATAPQYIESKNLVKNDKRLSPFLNDNCGNELKNNGAGSSSEVSFLTKETCANNGLKYLPMTRYKFVTARIRDKRVAPFQVLRDCSRCNHNSDSRNDSNNNNAMNSNSNTPNEDYIKIKKLRKREKHHSLTPNHTYNFPRSHSSSTINEPIIEVDETLETVPPLPETPKTPSKRRGSILSPGLVFDLVDGKLVITAGTEEKLLKTLADPNYPDDAYPRQFLLTLHYWTSPHVVFDKLREFYVSKPTDPENEKLIERSRTKIVGVLLVWIELFVDFLDNKPLLDKLVAFLKTDVSNINKEHATKLAEALKNQLRPPSVSLPDPPEPYRPTISPSAKLGFLDIHPVEIARQITLLEHIHLCKIKYTEFHQKKWAEKNAQDLCPNLQAYIERFNHVSYWVATEIVFQPELKKRKQVVKQFIVAADTCRQLGNFQVLMAICAGLHQSSIQRLKKTWKSLDKKYTSALDALMEIMDNKNNFKNYRDLIAKRPKNEPMIGYMGLVLKDLTFMEDGNPNKEEDMYNFDKFRMISDVISEVIRWQKMKYNFLAIKEIQDYIENATTWALNDNQLFKYAEKLEKEGAGISKGMHTL